MIGIQQTGVGQRNRITSIRVLICDELAVVREGLRMLLEPEPDLEVIDTTDSAMHAIMLTQTHQPAVVVTGLSLRGMSGLDLIRRLQQIRNPARPRVVVFTMSDDDDVVSDVLHAGACGVLVKNTSREDLSAAIRAAANGQAMLSPSVAQRLVGWFLQWDTQPEDSLRQVAAALSPREREVLLLIAKGMSAEEVAAELSIGLATVRTHVYRLRGKLDLRDRAQMVSFAYRAGLMRPA